MFRLGPRYISPSLQLFRPKVMADLFILIISLCLVCVFWISDGFQIWMVTSLGFGWIPTLIFLTTVVLVIRYAPILLLRYWRWWAISLAIVILIIGALSYVKWDYGVYRVFGLSGVWGQSVGGAYMPYGICRAIAIIFLIPLILFPKRVGRSYIFTIAKLTRISFITGRHLISRLSGVREILLISGRRIVGIFLRNIEEHNGSVDLSLNELDNPGIRSLKDDSVKPSALSKESREVQEDPEKHKSTKAFKSKWRLPSLELLAASPPRNIPQSPLNNMSDLIETTLSDHGVMVQVKDVRAGPRIIRFGLVPGWVGRKSDNGKPDFAEGNRVKVQSILNREKDLALALKTPNLRIEAPVPGEALVGLEVPSPTPVQVSLRGLMDITDFRKIISKRGLPIALGEDTGGNPVVTDLASLPHLLIAGATGSGKSVCLNSIIASLLFTKPPDQLRMVMVDPKRVELTPFNGIPHLIAPVIVDVDEVNPMLRALMSEMLSRYKLMEQVGARNISVYNAKSNDPMPYLVLIVDELADLMMVGGFEIEQNLVRLAQLGRATGIHLILATQRPSVNVVTGLLKANVPARVAFAVASQVDSRVILDTVGAEKLLGRGDMLLLTNDSPKARRVQGALVFDEEIDRVVEFWIGQKGPPLSAISLQIPDETDDDGNLVDGDILEKARGLAVRNPHLSASFFERRLRIGSTKAEQVVEILEEEGLIIPN